MTHDFLTLKMAPEPWGIAFRPILFDVIIGAMFKLGVTLARTALFVGILGGPRGTDARYMELGGSMHICVIHSLLLACP